jgi:hypothetical protein
VSRYFYYHRTPTGHWTANLTATAPASVSAEGVRAALSPIYDIADPGLTLQECQRLYPPPEVAPAEVTDPPRVVYEGHISDGHLLSFYDLSANLMESAPPRETDEPFLAWMKRILPPGVEFIDLSAKKVRREGLIVNP